MALGLTDLIVFCLFMGAVVAVSLYADRKGQDILVCGRSRDIIAGNLAGLKAIGLRKEKGLTRK